MRFFARSLGDYRSRRLSHSDAVTSQRWAVSGTKHFGTLAGASTSARTISDLGPQDPRASLNVNPYPLFMNLRNPTPETRPGPRTEA